MCQVLCSTGALIGMPNNRNYKLLKQLQGKLSCDGYEFMMYSSWYGKADKIADYLQSIGLFTPVMVIGSTDQLRDRNSHILRIKRCQNISEVAGRDYHIDLLILCDHAVCI